MILKFGGRVGGYSIFPGKEASVVGKNQNSKQIKR
jgi:hypothetical protein